MVEFVKTDQFNFLIFIEFIEIECDSKPIYGENLKSVNNSRKMVKIMSKIGLAKIRIEKKIESKS